MVNNTGEIAWRAGCAISKSFNKSSFAAMRHAKEAEQSGKLIVFTNTKDVAETKAKEANDCLNFGVCSPPSNSVRFKAQPS